MKTRHRISPTSNLNAAAPIRAQGFSRLLPAIALATLIGSGLASAQLYWDSNGSTAGAGATPTGTWGTDAFWNTDSGGGSGTFSTTTSSSDNLVFVAGPGAASGNNAYAVTVSGTQSANGLTFQSSGALTISGGSINLGAGGITGNQYAYGTTARASVAISSAIALQADQMFANNGTAGITISGNMSGSANLTVSGSITLSGTNSSYSGQTTLSSGSLILGSATAIGTGTLVINGGIIRSNAASGSVVALSTNNAQTWGGDFSYGAAFGIGSLSLGTGAVTLTGNRVLTGVSEAGTNGRLSVGGVISDGGSGYSITKNGTARLVLLASSSFSGGLTLNAGELVLGNNAGSGAFAGTGVLTINGGSIITSSATNTGAVLTGYSSQVWGGDFSVTTGYGIQNMGTGSVLLSGGSRSVNIAAFQAFIVDGAIGDGGNAYGLTKTGAGSITLGGASTYTGDTVVNAGTLTISGSVAGNTVVNAGTLTISGANDRLATGGTLTVNGGASAGGTFNLGGKNQTVAGLSGGSGTVSGYVQNNSSSTTSTLTVTGTSTFDGVIRNNGGTGGTVALTKSTGGTLTLAGANTYTGATLVSAGTLLVNGSTTGSAVTVASGGILGGTGIITPGASKALTVNSGGTLAPGANLGTLTVALNNTGDSATFASGALFAFDLAAPGTSDVLAFTGLTLNTVGVAFNGNVVNFTNAGGLAQGVYHLFTFDQDNAYSGSLVIGSGLSGYSTSSFIYNANGIDLNVVPEPSTWVLLAFSLTVVTVFRRRKSL